MKRDYKGLTCRVIYTEPLRLLTTSQKHLRAKTKSDWVEETDYLDSTPDWIEEGSGF